MTQHQPLRLRFASNQRGFARSMTRHEYNGILWSGSSSTRPCRKRPLRFRRIRGCTTGAASGWSSWQRRGAFVFGRVTPALDVRPCSRLAQYLHACQRRRIDHDHQSSWVSLSRVAHPHQTGKRRKDHHLWRVGHSTRRSPQGSAICAGLDPRLLP